jgi:hypothetical protein
MTVKQTQQTTIETSPTAGPKNEAPVESAEVANTSKQATKKTIFTTLHYGGIVLTGLLVLASFMTMGIGVYYCASNPRNYVPYLSCFLAFTVMYVITFSVHVIGFLTAPSSEILNYWFNSCCIIIGPLGWVYLMCFYGEQSKLDV